MHFGDVNEDEIIGMVKDGEEIEVVNDSPGAKEKTNGKSTKMEVVSEKVGPEVVKELKVPKEKTSPAKAKKVVEKQEVAEEPDLAVVPAKGRKTAKKSPKKAAKKTIKVADDLELETIVAEVSPVLFDQIKGLTSITKDHNKLIFSAEKNADIRKSIFDTAVNKSLTILEMRQEKASMEDIFRKLTKERTNV